MTIEDDIVEKMNKRLPHYEGYIEGMKLTKLAHENGKVAFYYETVEGVPDEELEAIYLAFVAWHFKLNPSFLR